MAHINMFLNLQRRFQLKVHPETLIQPGLSHLSLDLSPYMKVVVALMRIISFSSSVRGCSSAAVSQTILSSSVLNPFIPAILFCLVIQYFSNVLFFWNLSFFLQCVFIDDFSYCFWYSTSYLGKYEFQMISVSWSAKFPRSYC